MGVQRKRSHLAVWIVNTPTRETTITAAENRDESMCNIPSMRELEGTRSAGKEGDKNEVGTMRIKKKRGREKGGPTSSSRRGPEQTHRAPSQGQADPFYTYTRSYSTLLEYEFGGGHHASTRSYRQLQTGSKPRDFECHPPTACSS